MNNENQSIFEMDQDHSNIGELEINLENTFQETLANKRTTSEVLPEIKKARMYSDIANDKQKYLLPRRLSQEKLPPMTPRENSSGAIHRPTNTSDLSLTVLPSLNFGAIKPKAMAFRHPSIELMPHLKSGHPQTNRSKAEHKLDLLLKDEEFSDLDRIFYKPSRYYKGVLESPGSHQEILGDSDSPSKLAEKQNQIRRDNLKMKFKPSDPSIEEKMAESSKNTNQDPETQKKSDGTRQSGANESSFKKPVVNFGEPQGTKQSDSTPSRSGDLNNPPAKDTTSIKLVEETGQQKKGMSQGVRLFSPVSPTKRSSMFQSRTRKEDTEGFQFLSSNNLDHSPRRQKKGLTSVIKTKLPKKERQVIPPQFQIVEKVQDEQVEKSVISNNSSSKKEPDLLHARNNTSEEVDLRSRMSDDDKSYGTKRHEIDQDFKLSIPRKSLSKPPKARPEWKSEESSGYRFIATSYEQED